MSTINIVVIACIAIGLLLFLNALLRGGRMIGGFMDQADKAKAARLQAARLPSGQGAAAPRDADRS